MTNSDLWPLTVSRMWPLTVSRMWPLLLILFCTGLQYVVSQVSDLPLSFSMDADIVHPIRVDEGGSFLTFDLLPRILKKRGLSTQTAPPTYYEISYQGLKLTFNLSQNNQLLAPGYVSEWRSGSIRQVRIQSQAPSPCHLMGDVHTKSQYLGNAAISVCSGLRGVFQLAEEDFLIEPVLMTIPSGEATPHRIYRRHVAEPKADGKTEHRSCGVKDDPNSQEKWERRRERWEQVQHTKHREHRIRPRSISKEKWVETLVVADPKMVEYHGNDNVENYVLTIMNMVAGLFHDASIGNRINIVIVRLILLESEEEELKVTHHADNTLRSFCKWQKSINMKGEDHPLHHDIAVLLTRKDICAAMNRPCETLGLSHVSGMCQPHRSCNINEDTGLPTAFTVTHELGHSFGVQHDGSGNDCKPQGKRPHIMSPQLLYDTSPLTWSRCSRNYITRFLDRGWGLCLDDSPSKELLDFPSVPPGVLYDVGHQCRLQYGAYSSFCQDIDNVCNTLWCSVGSTCHSKLDAAVDGTTCGDKKWCFNGDCVAVGHRPAPVDGSWSAWSLWSSCTRSCGAGVQGAERLCNNPIPRYGGRYCLGERKRYRVCNIVSCPSDTPSFRQVQCSHFDTVPYKGMLHQWIPVPSNINPCELHCRIQHEYFAEKLLDAVIDGTPCFEGNASRDLCINGICKNVGCDYEIDSNAVEDRCGVCHGDSSSCHTVSKTFEDSDGLGYVDIGLIPPGAREIRIEEVAEAGNFLALRSEDPETYFLNGKWTIQWNGDYEAAGTTFTYTRTGNWENLTAPGPTHEPVWIQLLFQEKNPGVRYQYTVRRDPDSSNEIQPPDFAWRYGTWTKCSATCGTGIQRQLVHCVEKVAGLVEERYCDFLTRPDDRQRSCNEEPCPPRWWVGEWQQCSTTCGKSGLQKRTVLCIQRVGLDEQRALQPTDCEHLPRPESSIPCNRHVLCPAIWQSGNWSQCSVSCGEGVQFRDVYCPDGTEGNICEPLERPSTKRMCQMPPCPPGSSSIFDWTGSGASSKELFNEILPGHLRTSGRSQSRDDNSISEGDFSSHGEGGQGKGGRVFVDDFYYDYNFINFHENLNYDPLEDNDISWGSDVEPREKEPITQALPIEDELGKKIGGNSEDSGNSVKHLTEIPSNHETSVDTFTTTNLHYNSEKAIVSPNILADTENKNTNLPRHNQWNPTTEDPERTNAPNAVTSHKDLIINFPGTSHYETSRNSILYSPEGSLPNSSLDPLHDVVQNVTLQSKSDANGGLILIPSTAQAEDLSSYSVPDTTPDPAGYLSPYPMSDSSLDTPHKLSPDSMFHASSDPTQAPAPYTVSDRLLIPAKELSPDLTQVLQEDKSNDAFTNHTQDLPEGQMEDTPESFLHDLESEDILLDTSQDFLPDFSWHSHWNPSSTIKADIKPSADPTTALPLQHLPVDPLSHLSPITEVEDIVTTVPQVATSLPATTDPPHLIAIKTQDFLPGATSSPYISAIFNRGVTTMIPATSLAVPTTHQQLPSLDSRDAQKSYWEVGNWSECSTSCGLGAMWRSVVCRAGESCDPNTKPAPARRCHLRPCASWIVGPWDKCSQSCGAGVKIRDVHCVDTRDKRLLRPFHCHSTFHKPHAQMPCYEQQCMEWYISSWRECSEECGGGMQQRLVTCPQTGLCSENLKPNSSRSCNEHPCTMWAMGPWGQVPPAPVTASHSSSVIH
ncbi:A disintegrin and metalloproteinase with thrombospondin motifs 7 isoform 2-T2 [Discoglossus pictus]